MSLPRPRLWHLVVLFGCLALAIALILLLQRPPRPLGVDAPPGAFSALRAVRHLAWVGVEPHPTGSPAHARVRERLVAEFRAAGLEVQTQRAVLQPPPRYRARASALLWVENVIARLKGTEGGGAVMLVTHYDSAPGSHGAADAGAGVVTQLEVLRALKAGPPFRHDVIFLVTDAEELGLVGAEAFASAHPWMAEVKRVVNLEARGTSGPAWVHETSEGNADLIAALAQGAPRAAATSLAYEISRLLPNGTDLMVLRPAGLRALGLAFTERVWDYHYPTDHPSRVDPASVQQMGETALGLVRVFAQGDLGPGTGRDAVYFNLLGFHLVRYPAVWVPWLSVLGLGLTAACLGRAFRSHGLRPAAVGRALGGFLGGLLAAAALGALLRGGLAVLHPLWGVREVLLSWSPGPYALLYNPWYLMVLAAAAVLALWLLPRLVRREDTRRALPTAVLVLWALLVPVLGAFLPGVSPVFQWPWLLALAGALLAPRRLWALVPPGLAILLLFLVIVPTLGSALGFSWMLAAALPLWLVLVAGLLWAGVERLQEARLLLPAAAALALVGLVGGGLWARATFRGRDFANVAYAANLDTGRAWWVAERQHEGPWTRRFLDQPRAGEPSWEGDGRLRNATEATMVHQEAPLLDVPRPSLEVRSDTTERGLRTLRLALSSAGAEELRLEGSGERLLSATVEGQPMIARGGVQTQEDHRITGSERRKPWRVALVAPPARDPVEVVLTFTPGSEPIRLGLQAWFGGLPAALGAKAQPLPGIRPIERGNRTLVMRVLEVP